MLRLDSGLLSGLLPSICRCCFMTPGSSFILTDSEFCLIITTVLLFIGELVAADGIATADVATDRTEVSGVLIQMFVIVVLKNLCFAGIAPGFGGAIYIGFHHSFPSLQVMLVFMGLGVGSRAFFRMMELLHLDLGWLPSSQIALDISVSTVSLPVYNRWILGIYEWLEECVLSGLCRNKFDISFRVAVG